MPRSIINIVNKKFNRLTVISGPEKRRNQSGKRVVFWKCKCDCGKIKSILGSNIRLGITKSCGCLNIERRSEPKLWKHNMSNTSIYNVWVSLKGRCQNPKNLAYKHYGGRGIKICKSWSNDFRNFYKWARDHYQQGLQIDRIDNDGNYEPSNCRFTTAKKNSQNRRNNRMIKYLGQTKCLSEWAREYGIHKDTFKSRIDEMGWSIHDALTKKVRKKSNK